MIVKTKLSKDLLKPIIQLDVNSDREKLYEILSKSNFVVQEICYQNSCKIKLKYDKFEFEIRSVAMIGWSLSERINGTMQPSLIDHYDLRVIVATIVKDLISRDL